MIRQEIDQILDPQIGLFQLLQQLMNVLLSVRFVLILKVLRMKYARPTQQPLEKQFLSSPESGVIQMRCFLTQEACIGKECFPGLTKA